MFRQSRRTGEQLENKTRMTVKELIAALSALPEEHQNLMVAVPKFYFPNDCYVYPLVRVEEMVVSGGHLTAKQIRPGATDLRGLHVTLG